MLDWHGHSQRIDRRPDHDGSLAGAVGNAGEDREVHGGLDWPSHVIDRVAHFTDDLVVFYLSIPSGADVLPDGVVTRKKLIRELLVDYDVMGIVEPLVFGKYAAAQQRDLHHAEVLWIRG